MLKRMVTVLVIVLAATLVSQAETWNLDNANSSIGFSVKHMVIATVRGQFENFEGKVNFDGKSLEKGSAEITIDVKSIDTNNDRRDNHLRSSDFFEADKFPTISFNSTKITQTGENEFQMTGGLTMKGITKPVTLDCIFNGTVTDPRGNERAGFEATGTIKRHDFNIAWDNKLQDGSFIAGEEIKLDIHAELVKAEDI
jgi:polyisoprenoid-binding protein YceI